MKAHDRIMKAHGSAIKTHDSAMATHGNPWQPMAGSRISNAYDIVVILAPHPRHCICFHLQRTGRQERVWYIWCLVRTRYSTGPLIRNIVFGPSFNASPVCSNQQCFLYAVYYMFFSDHCCLTVHVSYSSVFYLFGLFEHRFLRPICFSVRAKGASSSHVTNY